MTTTVNIVVLTVQRRWNGLCAVRLMPITTRGRIGVSACGMTHPSRPANLGGNTPFEARDVLQRRNKVSCGDLSSDAMRCDVSCAHVREMEMT